MWSSDAPRRPRRRLVNVKGPSKFRTASSAVDRPRLRYRCDAAAFHAWTPGLLPNDGMQYWMQYVCTRLLPFLRRAAATTPFPDTPAPRGSARDGAFKRCELSSPAPPSLVQNPARHRQPAPDASHASDHTRRRPRRGQKSCGFEPSSAPHHMINQFGSQPPSAATKPFTHVPRPEAP